MLHADGLELEPAETLEPKQHAHEEIRQFQPKQSENADRHEGRAEKENSGKALVVVNCLRLAFGPHEVMADTAQMIGAYRHRVTGLNAAAEDFEKIFVEVNDIVLVMSLLQELLNELGDVVEVQFCLVNLEVAIRSDNDFSNMAV